MRRLVGCELQRLLLGYRFVVTVAIVSLVAGAGIIARSPLAGVASARPVRSFGALSVEGTLLYSAVAPLLAGIVAGGSLAADRARHYPQWILIRGVGPSRFLVAKALAMATTAAAGLLVAQLVTFGAILIAFPLGNTDPAAGEDVLSPGLFGASPAVHDLIVAALLCVGTAALSLTGLVVGASVPNEYLAAAVPFVLVLASIYVFDGSTARFSPYTYMSLDESAGSIAGVLVYWGTFGILATALGVVLFRRKEMQ